MKKAQSSKTAEYMALFRALETVRPADRRLFEDRFAISFLRPAQKALVRVARFQPIGNLVRSLIDRRWPGPRTAGVARTRYIDDATAAAVAEGMQQVVVLGAGYDSRAYRLPPLESVDVFEVDHPNTSAVKQKVLSRALGHTPSNVQFVPIDFNTGSIESAMRMGGFNSRRPTLVIWEGVSNYLSADAVDATLHWCASLVAGSFVIFTYTHQRVFDAPHAFDGTDRLFARLAAIGEKWTFGLDPADLRSFLGRRGLVLQDDCGTVECRARYYGRDAGAMRGYEFYRMAIARVAES